MSIAYIALGKTEVPPQTAMLTVAHRFQELVVTVMNWCRIVSSSAVPGITHQAFTNLTYKLYDQVYKDPAMFSIPSYPLLSDQIASTPTPSLVSQSTQPPLLTTRTSASLPSHIQREVGDGNSSIGSRPASTELPSRPASTVSNRSLEQDKSFVADSVIAPLCADSDAIQAVASSSAVQPVATSSQICTVNPVKSKVIIDPAESMVLVRRYGKKIAAFKPSGGIEEWYLAEDVRQTYFPRLSLDEFLLKYNKDSEKKVLQPLTEDANLAFRHHYEMNDCESFDLALMLHADTLADLMKNR